MNEKGFEFSNIIATNFKLLKNELEKMLKCVKAVLETWYAFCAKFIAKFKKDVIYFKILTKLFIVIFQYQVRILKDNLY